MGKRFSRVKRYSTSQDYTFNPPQLFANQKRGKHYFRPQFPQQNYFPRQVDREAYNPYFFNQRNNYHQFGQQTGGQACFFAQPVNTPQYPNTTPQYQPTAQYQNTTPQYPNRNQINPYVDTFKAFTPATEQNRYGLHAIPDNQHICNFPNNCVHPDNTPIYPRSPEGKLYSPLVKEGRSPKYKVKKEFEQRNGTTYITLKLDSSEDSTKQEKKKNYKEVRHKRRRRKRRQNSPKQKHTSTRRRDEMMNQFPKYRQQDRLLSCSCNTELSSVEKCDCSDCRKQRRRHKR